MKEKEGKRKKKKDLGTFSSAACTLTQELLFLLLFTVRAA